jgi:5'-phosphate synthase pdxT subunit
MIIGILALQGAFAEHISMLDKLKVKAIPVRLPSELKGIDGLIIPGGESTSIGLLANAYNIASEIKRLATQGMPVFGTCAGMVLAAREVLDLDVKPLGLMDITVRRNAFGRQKDSFEAELPVPVLGKEPFLGIFIRAPLIERANGKTEILTRLPDGTAVAARQDRLIATAFHPELTDDPRFHRYFLDIVASSKS